jgi:dTDP-4-amino-4,6-dideoxygalactose transaminase
MMGLDLKPGDEVITADFTFAATVEVIALLQLTPVLVDVDLVNMNISIEAIKKAITPKTKAIVPVHLFGRAANMEAIMQIAKEHNLYVIEDNAQAIGANCKFSDGTKRKAGTIGHVASTSFFLLKISVVMVMVVQFLPTTMHWLTKLEVLQITGCMCVITMMWLA